MVMVEVQRSGMPVVVDGAPDEGGPPGQTRPDNLAALCRRHHRAKTHFGWRYHRQPDGSYRWTDPHGRRYVTTPSALAACTG